MHWWASGLLACLPPIVGRLFTRLPTRLLLKVRDDYLVLCQEDQEETQELGTYALSSLTNSDLHGKTLKATYKQIVLRLSANKALSKTIMLPMAAEANLRQVVGFEIDRLTPFSPQQVYYDARLVERQPNTRRLEVRFTVLPRRWLDTILHRLTEVELAPDIVDVEGEDPRINLLPSDKRPRKGQLMQRLQWALGGMALILLAVASVLPLWQQRSILVNDLLPRVNTAQREVQEILALRVELESSIEASHFLLQKRQQTPLAIELLNELTRIFPDGTWVERLEIKGNEVQVRGQSSQASALIGLVEESKFFNNVTFRSPITADRRTGNDRFYLSAQFARESS